MALHLNPHIHVFATKMIYKVAAKGSACSQEMGAPHGAAASSQAATRLCNPTRINKYLAEAIAMHGTHHQAVPIHCVKMTVAGLVTRLAAAFTQKPAANPVSTEETSKDTLAHHMGRRSWRQSSYYFPFTSSLCWFSHDTSFCRGKNSGLN